MTNDADRLTALLNNIRYPAGISPVHPGAIERAAFFPGGTGMVIGNDPKTAMPGNNLPKGGTLVLGHHFGSVNSYDEVVNHGGEMDRQGTWPTLIRLLRECDIDLTECFFTNAFMGLMQTDSSLGSHKGHRDRDFRDDCKRVLTASIEMQQPRLILVLGGPARRFVGEVVEGLDAWRKNISFPMFDEQRLSESGLALRGPSGAPMSAVSLIHPSMRDCNVSSRQFGEFTGHYAEVEMVKCAKRACGLS